MAGTTSGIIAGMNPLEYHDGSPYTIFFFQLIVIITISQLLYYPLSKIKQPRVISEVLTGIILSHTVLGRIPNFTKYVFPDDSIPGLSLVANIGICLLMFIVGCEVDIKFIKKHIVTALTVGIFNMAVPFGLGCLCAIGLWNDYRVNVSDLPQIKFTTFMVFIAVAMCITAFPVLVRILTELRLVKDRVGIVVLAAGITNDLLGWILLALSITLANASQSMVTLYIVLVAIGWCLFICYPARIILAFVLKKFLKEFDNPNSPSRLATMIILIMMFGSAFFTDIIGVHPIFGAFIVGTIVPRENNYVINLTSRIEDLVNIIFIPVYFAVAGLDVDLGLMNKGLDWGWAFGLIGVAMVGKIFGGMVAAKLHGLYWRESLTVGVLMSCKGIVEIVVLQTGMKAQIISKKTYSMLIFMAIITTFLTTPLTIYCYPSSYRENVQNWIIEKQKIESNSANGSGNGTENEKTITGDSTNDDTDKPQDTSSIISQDTNIQKMILMVNDVESISNGFLILDIFFQHTKLPIHAINLKTLTERTSDVLHASMMNDLTPDHDFNSLNSILSIFKIFCHFNQIPFTSEILYSLPENYLMTLFDNLSFSSNDLFILSISQRQYHLDYLNEIIDAGKDFDYYKGIFINNNQDLNEESSGSLKKIDELETKSFFSEDTILNPSALMITNISLYMNISKNKIHRTDRLAMKLFDMLIKNKDIRSARIVVDNLESDKEEYHNIVQWVKESEKIFQNIDFVIENKTNEIGIIETGKSIKKKIFSKSGKLYDRNLDKLVIVSTNIKEDLNLVDNLVSNHKKVIVLF